MEVSSVAANKWMSRCCLPACQTTSIRCHGTPIGRTDAYRHRSAADVCVWLAVGIQELVESGMKVPKRSFDEESHGSTRSRTPERLCGWTDDIGCHPESRLLADGTIPDPEGSQPKGPVTLRYLTVDCSTRVASPAPLL